MRPGPGSLKSHDFIRQPLYCQAENTQTAGLRPSLFLPARDFLASARIRGSYGFDYTVVNRRVNGDVIVRREKDGAWATLRTTDRVRRTARSGMRDFLPPAMVRRTSR